MLTSLKNQIKSEALKVLLKNAKHGLDKKGQEYFYICPALERYPYQWLWDSCFHSIVMTHFAPELAEREIETLLSMVQDNGFLPHILFWEKVSFPYNLIVKYLYGNENSNKLTQPPLVALAMEKVYSKTKNKEFLEKTLPLAKKFYLWLMKERDLDKDGLVSIIHPYEAGADHNPEFDSIYCIKKPSYLNLTLASIRTLLDCKKFDWDLEKISEKDYFNVESVQFNSLHALSLKSMSKLFEEIDNEGDARFFKKESERTEKAILKKCYDSVDDVFVDLVFDEKFRVPVTSFFSVIPIILENIDPVIVDLIVTKHLLNPNEFWLPYPIPSVPKNNPSFSSNLTRLLWRGPTWINVNWLIFNALIKKGYYDVAKEIKKKSVELVLKSGFREFYNPITGKGLRSKDYGWSTLVVDMIESQKNI